MDVSNKDIHMNTTKMYIDEYGNKEYFNLKRRYHREDGPALEYVDGEKHWFKEGQWHRVDGPAVEWENGTKIWYKEGLLHRVDGPSLKYSNGSKYWNILDKDLKEKEFNSWILRIQKFT